METAREYAKRVGFEVVGKIKRIKCAPDYDGMTGKLLPPGKKVYIDEAGNQYWLCLPREHEKWEKGWIIIDVDDAIW